MPRQPEDFVKEEDLDWHAITARLKRIEAFYGDEDFEVLQCPHCRKVFLLDYEIDKLFVDANDLTKALGAGEPLRCDACGKTTPADDHAVPSSGAAEEFRVTFAQILASPWHWALKASGKSQPAVSVRLRPGKFRSCRPSGRR